MTPEDGPMGWYWLVILGPGDVSFWGNVSPNLGQEVLASQLLAEVEVRDTPGLRRHTLICLYVCIGNYICTYISIYMFI